MNERLNETYRERVTPDWPDRLKKLDEITRQIGQILVSNEITYEEYGWIRLRLTRMVDESTPISFLEI